MDIQIPQTDEDFRFYVVKQFGELNTVMARQEGKLDAVIMSRAEDKQKMEAGLKDHEERLRSNEKKVWYFSAVGGATVFVLRGLINKLHLGF